MNIKHYRVKMKHKFYLFVAHGFHFSTKSIKSAQIALHHDIRQTFNDIVLYSSNKKTNDYYRVKKCKLDNNIKRNFLPLLIQRYLYENRT